MRTDAGIRPGSRGRAFAVLGLLVIACAEPAAPPSILEGEWGGPHFGIDVKPDRADTYFDCGHGHAETPIRIDGAGRFSVAGEYVVDAGPPRVFPARYDGVVEGALLEVVVRVSPDGSAPDTLGPFRASRGTAFDVVLCR